MKLIVATVRPFKVAEIVDAMAADPAFPGMTVIECRGFGREKAISHGHANQDSAHDFVAGQMILVAAPDAIAAEVARRVTQVAHTGLPGDGKVFVVPLESALRIASGAVDDEALR